LNFSLDLPKTKGDFTYSSLSLYFGIFCEKPKLHRGFENHPNSKTIFNIQSQSFVVVLKTLQTLRQFLTPKVKALLSQMEQVKYKTIQVLVQPEAQPPLLENDVQVNKKMTSF